jgi:hypothetical protein
MPGQEACGDGWEECINRREIRRERWLVPVGALPLPCGGAIVSASH